MITVFAGREGAKAEHLKRELEAAGKRIGPPTARLPRPRRVLPQKGGLAAHRARAPDPCSEAVEKIRALIDATVLPPEAGKLRVNDIGQWPAS